MTNEMHKRFDERFPQSDYTFVEHGTDEEPITGETHPMDRLANDDIKSFIQSEIDLAVANRDREIVEMIKKRNDIIPELYYLRVIEVINQ